jgi:integrase
VLEKMADQGRADCDYDRRFRALVLLATFASLRWGEVTALRRCDVDLDARLVRVRMAFSDRRSPGTKITLAPVKSYAGRRPVGIPAVIIPALREHMAVFVASGPGSLMFPGVQGAPLRRSNFNRMSGWPRAVRAVAWKACTFMICATPGTPSPPLPASASRT